MSNLSGTSYISTEEYKEVNDLANIKSAQKRIKVIKAKTEQNKAAKTALKTSLKKFETAVKDGNKETATALYGDVIKTVDQAASNGLIHKNNAARKKSRFTKLLNKMA